MDKTVDSSLPRVGVIGIGTMGRNHARVYSEMDNVHLIALADLNEKDLNIFAGRYHARPYTDYREMLAKEQLDIVSVVVPTRLHRIVAEDVIRHGVNLLIEKPLALTIQEGNEIIQLAHASNLKMGVGHIERFNPVVSALKQHLKDGLLGRVLQIMIRRVGPFPERIKDAGVFLDLATHDTDLMYYLTESEIQRSYAESAQMLHKQHEDIAVSLLRFTNGIIGVLVENWLSPTKIRDVTISGERGMLQADLLTQDLYYYENNYASSNWEGLQVFRGMAEGNMVRYYIPRNEPLRLELEAFVRTVVKNEPFPVSGEDSLRAMKLAMELSDFALNNNQHPEPTENVR